MDFEDTTGLAQLESMSAQGLDALAFGVVRMRPGGDVVAYNVWESKMAGLSKERVLARNFFSEVAPCTNNYMVAERFMGEPELDATLDYVFTLRMKPTAVKLRLLKSATAEHMYLLVKR
jgi:photoactive yellow protein